ncbi:hypothetical protein niasHT_000215 [Heterodera trifolii]|uniref:POU domain protein n=1 Tax=Heterodera trifolii TaxID=157864 RepID=A0ABD2LVJ0_9BILA
MMDRFFYAANPMAQFAFGTSAGSSEPSATPRLYAQGNQREENAGGDRGETEGGAETDAGGIMRIPTSANSIFGTYGEDSFLHLQQARALAEMDVKGVTAAVFHPYHSTAVVDFDASMGGILHASVADTNNSAARANSSNFQAEMAASLQQQMMQQMASIGMHHHAMHHYGVGHPSGAVSSANAALYPPAMTSQGMGLMGNAGLTNDCGGQHNVGGAAFLSPFSHQHSGAVAPTQQQQQQQHPQTTASAQLRVAPNGALPVPAAMLPSSSGVPPSMVPGLSVLNSGIKPSSQHNTPLQQQRYPVLHGAHLADLDTDPRELERFAEHFKQRRIKLGVTQADVGKALAYLKMPGVGSLSQSTICRFESLTLSHNNMVALKPILHSWLEKAEEATKNAMARDGAGEMGNGGAIHCAGGILPCVEKKRKRTSIAAPEKRMLEEFFRQQSRPTGDRISAIAEKLDLKKNVVRVWFCNQRQKQKRNQFRHCRNGVGAGGVSAPIAATGSAETNQQQPTLCGSGGGNAQHLMANPLDSSAAAATLAAAAMQAMQQQQQHNHNNNSRTEINGEAGGGTSNSNNTTAQAQIRTMKQSQQNDDIFGEALLKGTMAQLQRTCPSGEEMLERKAPTDTEKKIAGSGDNVTGVIRHGFCTKAMKMAPTERTNDGTTESRGMGAMEMFSRIPPNGETGAIFYLSNSNIIAEN